MKKICVVMTVFFVLGCYTSTTFIREKTNVSDRMVVEYKTLWSKKKLENVKIWEKNKDREFAGSLGKSETEVDWEKFKEWYQSGASIIDSLQ